MTMNNIPKKGWQQELAKMAKCTPTTVNNAIHHNAPGIKAEKVRWLYRQKYTNNQTEKSVQE
jgi:hypothetical protein